MVNWQRRNNYEVEGHQPAKHFNTPSRKRDLSFQQSCSREESKPGSKTQLLFYYDDDFSCAITNPVRSAAEGNRRRTTLLEQYAEKKNVLEKGSTGETTAPRLLSVPSMGCP